MLIIKIKKLVKLEGIDEGKRPTVRGVVMNPVDHPHGGGEGKHLEDEIQSLLGVKEPED